MPSVAVTDKTLYCILITDVKPSWGWCLTGVEKQGHSRGGTQTKCDLLQWRTRERLNSCPWKNSLFGVHFQTEGYAGRVWTSCCGSGTRMQVVMGWLPAGHRGWGRLQDCSLESFPPAKQWISRNLGSAEHRLACWLIPAMFWASQGPVAGWHYHWWTSHHIVRASCPVEGRWPVWPLQIFLFKQSLLAFIPA